MTQALDKQQFGQWITVLSEACRQPLSQPTIASYYSYFNGKLSTEQFCNAAQQLFEQGCDRLPPPIEWVKLARSLTPDMALPAAPEEPAYADMDDFQKAAFRRKVQAARAIVAESAKQSAGFSHIGGLLSAIDPQTTAQKRRAQVEKMNRWLNDPTLRKEAIAWAVGQSDVELQQDVLGEVSGLRLVGEEDEASA